MENPSVVFMTIKTLINYVTTHNLSSIWSINWALGTCG